MLVLLERVNEAQRLAVRELKEMQAQDPRNKKRKRGSSDHDGGSGGGGDKDSQESYETGSARDYHGSKERKTNSKGKSSRR